MSRRPAQPMPRWLKHLLLEAGHLTSDGATRAAHATRCRRCNAPIVIGLDHERTALTARCDPQPLNPEGEYRALLAGRTTYTITWRYSRYELDNREPEHITAHPAGHPDNRFDVLATHTCRQPIPTQHQATAHAGGPRHHLEEPDQCPY